MIKTLNGREIHFTGEELSDIRPLTNAYKNIKTLEELFEILLRCYEKQTAYPPCQNDYDKINNPTSGQCAITSVIVQEIFGGTIHEITVTEDMTHLFNLISGRVVDLTCDQFTLFDIPLNYDNNREVVREECLSNENTNKRYMLLKKKLIQQIKSFDKAQER